MFGIETIAVKSVCADKVGTGISVTGAGAGFSVSDIQMNDTCIIVDEVVFVLVISCGGGTVLRKENADILKKNGRVFYLKIDAKTVIERLKDDCSRPLLQRDDKEAAINELLSKRSPIYEAVCDYKIDADSGVDSVVDRIIELSI